jgi:hypothetical protein
MAGEHPAPVDAAVPEGEGERAEVTPIRRLRSREYNRLDPRFSGPASSLAADTAAEDAEAGRTVDTATRYKLGGYFVLNPTAFGAATRRVDNPDVSDSFKCGILRCIFGPLPFSEVRIDPAWLTWNNGTVRRLAEAAYEERVMPNGHLDRTKLAVLADALEECGATDRELLDHLRQPDAVHVRGCWCVDLLLGRG